VLQQQKRQTQQQHSSSSSATASAERVSNSRNSGNLQQYQQNCDSNRAAEAATQQ